MGIGIGGILLQQTVRSSTCILYYYAVQQAEVCSKFYYDESYYVQWILWSAAAQGCATRVEPEIAWRGFQEIYGKLLTV